MVKNIQQNEFDNNELTNLDSITVIRGPTSDNELSNKKYVNDVKEEDTIVRFHQTLKNYLKVCVGNDTYNLTEDNKIQLTDINTFKAGKTGSCFLPYWKIVCSDKNINGKKNFNKSTKTNSPSNHSGTESLPHIGNAFIYIETISNNHGVFFSNRSYSNQ